MQDGSGSCIVGMSEWCASPGLHSALSWAEILPLERDGLGELLLAMGVEKKHNIASDERASISK